MIFSIALVALCCTAGVIERLTFGARPREIPNVSRDYRRSRLLINRKCWPNLRRTRVRAKCLSRRRFIPLTRPGYARARIPGARIVARVAEHAAYEYLMHPVHN